VSPPAKRKFSEVFEETQKGAKSNELFDEDWAKILFAPEDTTNIFSWKDFYNADYVELEATICAKPICQVCETNNKLLAAIACDNCLRKFEKNFGMPTYPKNLKTLRLAVVNEILSSSLVDAGTGKPAPKGAVEGVQYIPSKTYYDRRPVFASNGEPAIDHVTRKGLPSGPSLYGEVVTYDEYQSRLYALAIDGEPEIYPITKKGLPLGGDPYGKVVTHGACQNRRPVFANTGKPAIDATGKALRLGMSAHHGEVVTYSTYQNHRPVFESTGKLATGINPSTGQPYKVGDESAQGRIITKAQFHQSKIVSTTTENGQIVQTTVRQKAHDRIAGIILNVPQTKSEGYYVLAPEDDKSLKVGCMRKDSFDRNNLVDIKLSLAIGHVAWMPYVNNPRSQAGISETLNSFLKREEYSWIKQLKLKSQYSIE
jgi:hypothetical protein